MTIATNRLTVKETLQLVRWLEANREFLHRVPRNEIGRRAQAALGFEVTGHNVTGACEAGGIEIEVVRTELTSEALGKTYFVAHALVELYEALGSPVPGYLRALANNAPTSKIVAEYNAHRAPKG